MHEAILSGGQSLVRRNGDGTVSKIYDGPFRRILARRAHLALTCLRHVDRVPRPVRVAGNVLTMTELPSVGTLAGTPRPHIQSKYFEVLFATLQECNSHGVSLVDMAANNLGIDRSGMPLVFDFDAAILKSDPGFRAMTKFVTDLQVIALRRKSMRFVGYVAPSLPSASVASTGIYYAWRATHPCRSFLSCTLRRRITPEETSHESI